MHAFRWHGHLPGWLILAQVIPLGFALENGLRWAWFAAFAIAVPANLWGWLVALRIRRAIRDTPTSKVASAAQGYVELQGIARPHEGLEVRSPLTQLACLWYRYCIEERRGDEWREVEHGESEAAFELDDGSGLCVIHPAGAQIQSRHKEVRHIADQRHTEWILLKQDVLYAIGAFRSERGVDAVLDARTDEGELLAQWKQNQAALQRRFDLDGDGEISPREWMLARLAARREVARQHAAIRQQAVKNRMAKPGDGRPYLISNQSPQSVGRQYVLWAGLHATLVLGALAGIGWAMQLPA